MFVHVILAGASGVVMAGLRTMSFVLFDQHLMRLAGGRLRSGCRSLRWRRALLQLGNDRPLANRRRYVLPVATEEHAARSRFSLQAIRE